MLNEGEGNGRTLTVRVEDPCSEYLASGISE